LQQSENVAEDVRRLYQYYLYNSQPELRELIVRVEEIFTKYEENQVVHPILASDLPLASDSSFLSLSRLMSITAFFRRSYHLL